MGHREAIVAHLLQGRLYLEHTAWVRRHDHLRAGPEDVVRLALPEFGGGLGFPIGLGMRIGGDVDVFTTDARAFDLLDVHSTFRYRHPCGCFRFALRGGHVVGREGVDVFANLELTPNESPGAATTWW